MNTGAYPVRLPPARGLTGTTRLHRAGEYLGHKKRLTKWIPRSTWSLPPRARPTHAGPEETTPHNPGATWPPQRSNWPSGVSAFGLTSPWSSQPNTLTPFPPTAPPKSARSQVDLEPKWSRAKRYIRHQHPTMIKQDRCNLNTSVIKHMSV